MLGFENNQGSEANQRRSRHREAKIRTGTTIADDDKLEARVIHSRLVRKSLCKRNNNNESVR